MRSAHFVKQADLLALAETVARLLPVGPRCQLAPAALLSHLATADRPVGRSARCALLPCQSSGTLVRVQGWTSPGGDWGRAPARLPHEDLDLAGFYEHLLGRMDQFSAHLDRGWDLVQRGDIRGAEASARRALELEPGSPEAHNLLGYVAALEGDGDEAIENYRQAIALDETYLEAMLNAAEVYIHPLGDFDQAINMCDQALDLAEVDEEIIDALLLKFDALLAKGDMEEAALVVAKIPEGPYDNPNHTFLVGRALYEIGQTDRATKLIEEAALKDPRNVEAYYYLGLVRDEAGDMRGATQAFLHARELDLELGVPPWMPSREAFLGLAQKAVAALNPVLRRYVDGADVYVSDVPGMELVAEGVDPRALILIDGILGDDIAAAMRNEAPCARVFVYAMNVARLAGGAEGIEHEIGLALEREITATFLEAEQAERPESELN